jgi:pilus assembly protein CpaC
LTRLKEKLREILPGENIQVTATHEGVTLFGEVSSMATLPQALAVAEAFAPQKITNLLQVSGVHQVMLEVRIAEISRSLTRRLLVRGLGLNYATFTGDASLRLGLLNNVAALADLFPASAFFRFDRYGLSLTSFIDALKENGLVKILAEPTLVTLSGQEASFLAGGEFPIPTPQRDNVVTIEFRPFGVALRFTPTVLSSKKISLQVAPEVSELDFTNAVAIAGLTVPSLTIRRASTVIELADGQSFAIAGLLNESVRETISKFPLLGDIPILGTLFRSSSFQKNETELIILVTPHLVKPLDLSKQTLPTNQFIEPNDVEFYLLGKTEGRGAGQKHTARLDGEFGYVYGPVGDQP